MEPEQRILKINKNLYQNAKNGDFSGFLEVAKNEINNLKKVYPNSQLDVEAVDKFFKDLVETEDLKAKIGNLGLLRFLSVTFFNLHAACLHKKQQNENMFIYDDDKICKKFINNFWKDYLSLKESLISYDYLKELNWQDTCNDVWNDWVSFLDDISSDKKMNLYPKDLNKWLYIFSAFCCNEGIAFDVCNKEGKSLGKAFGFGSDGRNGFYWGVIFDESIAQDDTLKKECFDSACTFFEKVFTENNVILGDYLRFFCNDKHYCWNVTDFYKKVGFDKKGCIGKTSDFCSNNKDEGNMWILPRIVCKNCLFFSDMIFDEK